MKKLLKQLLIITVLLLSVSGVARAGSTIIRSHISAVRIVVVDNYDQITEVYSNTDQDIEPEVRLGDASGEKTRLTDSSEKQYTQIQSHIPQGSKGKVYTRQLPSLIKMLYAML